MGKIKTDSHLISGKLELVPRHRFSASWRSDWGFISPAPLYDQEMMIKMGIELKEDGSYIFGHTHQISNQQ